MHTPFVFIVMFTYNHEHFIAQAIESILMQETNFNYKLYIGEDSSTDKTKNICLSYMEKYKDKIEVVSTVKNNIKENSLNTWRASVASGAKYIANCEGDDYWTDPHKLQKQIDFLEKNNDFVAVGHNVRELIEGEYFVPESSVNNFKKICLNDTGYHTPCHTCSLVARNVLNPWPDFLSKSPIGDWPIQSLLLAKGDMMIMPDVMAVYRKNTGMWSSMSRIKQINGIIVAINLMLVQPEFDNFKLFKEHLSLTKINYIKEVATLIENDASPQYESEINSIKYFEDKIEELNSIFKDVQRLSAKVTVPVLIKTLQKKIFRSLKNKLNIHV